MTNIATLGVALDPSGFVSGAAVVTTAVAGIVAATRGAGAAVRALGQGRGGFAALAAAAQTSARSMAGYFNRATLGITGAFGLMARNVISDLKGIISAGRGVMTFFAQFGLAVNGIKSALAPVTGLISKAFDFTKESVQIAADMESTELAIKNLLSSSSKARVMMKELQDLAKNTTLSFPETADAARQLLSYGLAADKVIPSLKRLADLSAMTGGKSSINDLAYLYGTAGTQTQIYKRDLNQFANRGIDVVGAMSLAMQKSKAEVMDLVSKGKIGFKQLEAAIVQMTEKGGIAFGSQATQMESWNGRVAKLEESWTLLQQAIGKPIIDGLKPLLDDLSGIVDDLTKQVKDMYPAIKAVADYIPAAFRVMRQEGGLKLAFEAATSFLSRKLTQIWEYSKAFLGATFDWVGGNFSRVMKYLASDELWAGVGRALVKGIKEALNVLKAGAEGIDKAIDSATGADLERRAAVLKEQSKKFSDATARQNTPGSYDSYVRPDAMRAADEATIKRHITIELPQLEKGPGGPDNYLIPQGPQGISFNAPNWSDYNSDPTASENQFTDALQTEITKEKIKGVMIGFVNWLSGNTEAAQEEAAAARRAQGDILNPPDAEAVDKTAERRAAAAAKAAARADAMLEKTADRINADADPEAKYRQRLALIEKLKDAGKMSAEEVALAESKAAEQYQLDMAKKVKSTEKAAKAMETPLQQLAKQWGDMHKNAQQAAVGIAEAFSSHITGSLMDMITGAKSVKDAFAAMALGIVNDIAKIIVQMLVQLAISRALKGTMGGGGGGLFGLGLFGILHTGGEAGNPPATRVASSSMLSSARRYHSGGVAGLNAGEVPAILERGEHVMTRKQTSAMKRRMTGTGQDKAAAPSKPGVIINAIDPRQIAALMAENPDATVNVINLRRQEIKTILGR